MESFEDTMRRGGAIAIAETGRFFMGEDAVHQALKKIAKRLADLNIPYAVAGGMALVAHGYRRTTSTSICSSTRQDWSRSIGSWRDSATCRHLPGASTCGTLKLVS